MADSIKVVADLIEGTLTACLDGEERQVSLYGEEASESAGAVSLAVMFGDLTDEEDPNDPTTDERVVHVLTLADDGDPSSLASVRALISEWPLREEAHAA